MRQAIEACARSNRRRSSGWPVPAPDERRHEAARGRRDRHRGHPEVLIADEPTTALDVTIQAQYLKLLKRLQQETGMAIIFITHDFGIVAGCATGWR